MNKSEQTMQISNIKRLNKVLTTIIINETDNGMFKFVDTEEVIAFAAMMLKQVMCDHDPIASFIFFCENYEQFYEAFSKTAIEQGDIPLPMLEVMTNRVESLEVHTGRKFFFVKTNLDDNVVSKVDINDLLNKFINIEEQKNGQ